MNSIALTVQSLSLILFRPDTVFNDVESKKLNTLIPLLVSFSLSIWFVFYYYNTVDFNWLVSEMAIRYGYAPEEASDYFSKNGMIGFTIVYQLFINFVVLILYSLYLYFVSVIFGDTKKQYSDWWSLLVWSYFPNVILVLSMITYYLLQDSNMVFYENLNFMSLNALVTGFPVTHKYANIATTLTPFIFWNLFLVSIGVRKWLDISYAASFLIAFSPALVGYIIWFFVA
ncbi:YIP1 family protein [Teredinibacter sp. KSP-S5-2]|uniref:YIP1 family protein n=1 Tax=Teredinibacter sp. KSP-S5-2 TaxID=3034506 RepID=UPI002934B919|nr:YIP1 family protein [Teredinibacter sp. KSP-S5-2]WNO11300.1 YIP1 family protein [Teredinibacter sp. KSP-S5-2]